MLTDTHPDADAVLIELWRNKSRSDRFARVTELTEMTRQNAKRAIRKSRAGATPTEIGLRFIELHYGHELANDVREYLQRRAT